MKIRILLILIVTLLLTRADLSASEERSWSVTYGVELLDVARGELKIGRYKGKMSRLAFLFASTSFQITEPGAESNLVGLSLTTDVVRKRNIAFSWVLDAGVIGRDRDPDESADLDSGSEKTSFFARGFVSTRVPLSSHLALTKKLGLEYTPGKGPYIVSGAGISFYWGRVR